MSEILKKSSSNNGSAYDSLSTSKPSIGEESKEDTKQINSILSTDSKGGATKPAKPEL